MRRSTLISLLLLTLCFSLSAQRPRREAASKGSAAVSDTMEVAPPELDIQIVDSSDSLPPAYAPLPHRTKKEIKLSIDTLTFSDEFLDTLVFDKKKRAINDYTMIGVQYGAGLCSAMYNPSRAQRMRLSPVNFGFLYTRYGKMFDYMPYFGIQLGAFYESEGYRFNQKLKGDDRRVAYLQDGADNALFHTANFSAMAHCHVDFWKMKLMLNLGYYVGYRLDITRYRDEEIISKEFMDHDKRFDYGLKGGAGVGFVFDPIEIHLSATYKHSFSPLFRPDYQSSEYYQYAYPYSIVISLGVHVQLTKREGKTTKQIKSEARDAVEASR